MNRVGEETTSIGMPISCRKVKGGRLTLTETFQKGASSHFVQLLPSKQWRRTVRQLAFKQFSRKYSLRGSKRVLKWSEAWGGVEICSCLQFPPEFLILEVKHSNNWAGAPYHSNPQGWSWIQAFIKSHQLTLFLQNLGNFLAFSCFDKEFGGSTFLTACGLRCSSKDRSGKNSQKLSDT